MHCVHSRLAREPGSETDTSATAMVVDEMQACRRDQPTYSQCWSIRWSSWSTCVAPVVNFDGSAGQLVGFLQYLPRQERDALDEHAWNQLAAQIGRHLAMLSNAPEPSAQAN